MTKEQFLERLEELNQTLRTMWDETNHEELFQLYRRVELIYNDLVSDLLVRDHTFEEIK